MHGRLDLPDLKPFYKAFPDVPPVSTSNDQRRPIIEKPRGNYLAFLGRISPEKRPDRAIEIAARVSMPLKIAAKIDNADKAYWQTALLTLATACSVPTSFR